MIRLSISYGHFKGYRVIPPTKSYDNTNVEAATKRGICVTNTPGVLTDTTADYAFALLMAVARRIVEADRYVGRGDWKIPWGLTMLGSDAYGKTIGVVGLGRIS